MMISEIREVLINIGTWSAKNRGKNILREVQRPCQDDEGRLPTHLLQVEKFPVRNTSPVQTRQKASGDRRTKLLLR